MREILFRGKRIDNGEWVKGYVTRIKHSDDKGKAESYYFNALDELGWVFECAVSAETVCQYTGLTDKNGRKIFEGDILCNHYDEKFPEEETMSVIVWDRFGWGIKYRDVVGKLDDFDCKNGEVTGNIFDNPELIGGKEE